MIEEAVSFLSHLWRLSNIRPLEGTRLVNNYLVVAHSAVYAKDVVLKILLWEDARIYEVKALRYFNGRGCIEVLAYNDRYHALLLPYVRPGDTLRSLFPEHDADAVRILVDVSNRLHVCPVTESELSLFPSVKGWLKAFEKTYAQIPDTVLDRARLLAKRLLADTTQLYVLHGDLHHENILKAGDSWLAIDPKGVIGEREYEFGAFIRNPYPLLIEYEHAEILLAKRIELCSKLTGFDAQRIADWAFVQAVLSACWAHEGNKDVLMRYFITCATMLQQM